jgi:hypothetical protein
MKRQPIVVTLMCCLCAVLVLACEQLVADHLSRALPGWNVVVMPAVNYGSSGANQMASVAIHPGTYGVPQSTLGH